MANLCKFEKKQYKVSYDNGVTWNTVVPEQNKPGDMIEYDSQDCSSIDTMYRWRVLDGQYLCEDKEKYKKEIQEESYDVGATWYVSYPTVYRKGQYVGRDETYCNDKFVGHYIPDDDSICPGRYKWNGYKCVYIDPLKIIKCDDNTILTSGDPVYYTSGYALISAVVGNCVTLIGDGAFWGCSSLTSIDIPSGVTTIGDYAFCTCRSLTSIDIPSGVTSIGRRAFSGCTSLTSIDIPDSVTSIGGSVFFDCYGLTSCTIGSGVTSIGGSAFFYCSSLTSIDIPSGVTSIGGEAFRGCTSLTGITINAITPPTLGTYVFDNSTCPIYVPCESVVAYRSASGWSTYKERIQGIPPCVESVKFSATYSDGRIYSKVCDSNTLTSGDTRPSGYTASTMTSAEIGDCVTSINDYAFASYTSLSSVTIPSGVTSIGSGAFRESRGLTNVTCLATAPPTLRDAYVFYNTNSNLVIYVPCESVVAYRSASGWSDYASRIQGIPPCVDPPKFQATYSGGRTYSKPCDSNGLTSGDTKPSGYETSAMTSVEIGDCVTEIGDRVFYDYTSLSSVTIPSGVTYIGEWAFNGCSSLTSITIPSGVTVIGIGAFGHCTSLSSITIPNSVTSIDQHTFGSCTSLSSVTIPNSVTRIGSGAFQYCSSLTAITIPNSVTRIDTEPFRYCTSLTTIIIPSGVTMIGTYAFESCSNLTSVTVLAPTPPRLGYYTFDNTSSNLVIYVPAESVDAYKSSWSDYASRIQPIS